MSSDLLYKLLANKSLINLCYRGRWYTGRVVSREEVDLFVFETSNGLKRFYFTSSDVTRPIEKVKVKEK